MNAEDDLNDFMKQFERMFERMFMEGNVDVVPLLLGWCNCCFLQSKGHFVKYRYEDGEIVELFICLECRNLQCEPEGDCKVEGCNFIETYEKYVTQ